MGKESEEFAVCAESIWNTAENVNMTYPFPECYWDGKNKTNDKLKTEHIMKKLNQLNIKEEDFLNRNELKSIMAGSGKTNCLFCTGSISTETFCINYSGLDPTLECR